MLRSRYKLDSIILASLTLLISYFTIFSNYQTPEKFFWDENYHVAAAQKYLHGVFFMEPHPPLGKLLIAAGEYLFHPNANSDQFLETDHASDSPPGFSFAGYRFFPVLLATFCPLLIFLIVKTFGPSYLAFFISLLFALDNALVVHLRGAMLEGTQLFFILSFLLTLALLVKRSDSEDSPSSVIFPLLSILAGAFTAATITTKLNGLVLFIPLAPYLLSLFRKGKLLTFVSNFSISFIAVFILVWCIHISLGKTIKPRLPDSGYYQASVPYRIALQNNSDSSINFFGKLYDQIAFFSHYTKGVPQINFCNKEENGSPWYWWLVGGKSISYRWDKKDKFMYFIYLVANPVGWALSLSGVLLSAVVIGSYLFFTSVVPKQTFQINVSLFLAWIFYLGIFGSLGRVVYLYHYFIPLVFGWLMLANLIPALTHIGKLSLSESRKSIIIGLLIVAQISAFIFFSPLTYAKAITNYQLKRRNWLPVWDIHCAGCPSENPIARAIADPKKSLTNKLTISGLDSLETYQAWGEPIMNLSVTKEKLIVAGKTYESGLGVHAQSKIIFATAKRLKLFSAKVGLPDYLISKGGGSVIFYVAGDGKELWRSGTIIAGQEPVPLSLDIQGIDRLILGVEDAGDGNTDDHAVWLEPKFE